MWFLTSRWSVVIASLAVINSCLAVPFDLRASPHKEQDPLLLSQSQDTYGLPIEAVPYFNAATLHYNTHIGIGSSPSQLFTAAIDLNWADTWVVSSACNLSHHLRYNSSKSPSYEANGTAMHLIFPIWPELDGIVSTDTIALGEGLEVEHQPFVEVLDWQGFRHEFDAVLGLSPTITRWQDENSSQPHLPSPFMGLVDSGTLKNNMFSLLLPHDQHDIGDLSFGTFHPEFSDGPLIRHPLHPTDAPFWQIEAPDIAVRRTDGTAAFTHSYAGFTAQFDSVLSGMLLSSDVADRILRELNATAADDCDVLQVPCDQRGELPELVFAFAGQEIVLTGYDYMVETDVLMCFGGPWCVPMVYPGLPSLLGDKTIMLGTTFLKNVYTVFDWDERSVSSEFAVLPAWKGDSTQNDRLLIFENLVGKARHRFRR